MDLVRTHLMVNFAGGPFERVEMTRRSDGRHVRLSNGRRHRPVGRYASIKMGASVPWESRLELHDIYRAEVDPEVVSYAVQPETLSWSHNGTRYRYTPDRLDSLASGGTRIVEVKNKFDADSDPRYAEKLLQAANIYAVAGHIFEMHEESYIHREPCFSAIEEVQAYRRATVTPADVAVARTCAQSKDTVIADLLRALPSRHPRAALYAMIVRRFVLIDFSAGLRDSSQVMLGPGMH